MKRAIYVGRPYELPNNRLFSYGVTGQITLLEGCDTLCDFLPDGASRPALMLRRNLYVPSEDQTRHCSKP